MLQYNGCTWRGSVLRVELAKPDYAVRAHQEQQAAEEAEREAAEAAEKAAAAAAAGAATLPMATGKLLIRAGTRRAKVGLDAVGSSFARPAAPT
jgi:hypothetical protein